MLSGPPRNFSRIFRKNFRILNRLKKMHINHICILNRDFQVFWWRRRYIQTRMYARNLCLKVTVKGCLCHEKVSFKVTLSSWRHGLNDFSSFRCHTVVSFQTFIRFPLLELSGLSKLMSLSSPLALTCPLWSVIDRWSKIYELYKQSDEIGLQSLEFWQLQPSQWCSIGNTDLPLSAGCNFYL